MWAGLSCFLSSGDGYVGELLELQQGCEGPFSKFQILDVISLEKPQRKWASSRLEGRTSWIFSLRQVLSTYDGDLRDPLWWRQERPFPMRVAREPLGIPLPSMPGPKI